MIAVIFEVYVKPEGKATYLSLAAELRPLVENRPGLLAMERFQSLGDEGKLLSLSWWEDEESLAAWRNEMRHRMAQRQGRESLFNGYRIRVARVLRDYTDKAREEAPLDSPAR